ARGPPQLEKEVEGYSDYDEQESKDQRLILSPPDPPPFACRAVIATPEARCLPGFSFFNGPSRAGLAGRENLSVGFSSAPESQSSGAGTMTRNVSRVRAARVHRAAAPQLK